MPRKNKHGSGESSAVGSMKLSRVPSMAEKPLDETEVEDDAGSRSLFTALKSIDKIIKKEKQVIRKSKQKVELQLSRKAKRKLNKLKNVGDQVKQTALARLSKTSNRWRDSFLSEVYDDDIHGLLILRKSKEDDIQELTEGTEMDVTGLRKLLSEHEQSTEDEPVEQSESDKESSDSYVEDKEETMERIRKTFKKSSYFGRKTPVTMAENFFETLGNIPSIENISLDLSDSDFEAYVKKKKSEDDLGKDIGHFVDPLTGALIESSSSTSSSSSKPIVPELAPETSIMIEDQDSGAGILEESDEVDEDLDRVSEREEDKDLLELESDELGKWFDIPSRHVGLKEDKFDPTKTEPFTRLMIPIIIEFVYELINQVVETAVYSEPSTLLRQNLSKKKIMDDLNAKLQELTVERHANLFLNKKVIEFFRRKKDFRPITDDPSERVMPLIERYNENIDKLSVLLSQEEEFNNVTSINISNLNEKLQQEEKFSKQSIDIMEKLIKKTIVRERFVDISDLVTQSLKQMANTHEEISEQRFMLLKQLHSLAKLKEKEDKLEDLGNGLTLHHFEHLQAQATNVGMKNEERANELNRLHIKRNKFLHIIAHVKERHKMLQNSLEVQESALEDLLEERHQAREGLNYQKFIRQKIRHETDVLTQQSGLIGNSALMLDYDKTMSQLEEARARVKQLKLKNDQLQKRFSRLEIRYSTST